jgi:hypothetical protein
MPGKEQRESWKWEARLIYSRACEKCLHSLAGQRGLGSGPSTRQRRAPRRHLIYGTCAPLWLACHSPCRRVFCGARHSWGGYVGAESAASTGRALTVGESQRHQRIFIAAPPHLHIATRRHSDTATPTHQLHTPYRTTEPHHSPLHDPRPSPRRHRSPQPGRRVPVRAFRSTSRPQAPPTRRRSRRPQRSCISRVVKRTL